MMKSITSFSYATKVTSANDKIRVMSKVLKHRTEIKSRCGGEEIMISTSRREIEL
jgi:hypothetical protein